MRRSQGCEPVAELGLPTGRIVDVARVKYTLDVGGLRRACAAGVSRARQAGGDRGAHVGTPRWASPKPSASGASGTGKGRTSALARVWAADEVNPCYAGGTARRRPREIGAGGRRLEADGGRMAPWRLSLRRHCGGCKIDETRTAPASRRACSLRQVKITDARARSDAWRVDRGFREGLRRQRVDLPAAPWCRRVPDPAGRTRQLARYPGGRCG